MANGKQSTNKITMKMSESQKNGILFNKLITKELHYETYNFHISWL